MVLTDVSGKGSEAGSRVLLLSGAFDGLEVVAHSVESPFGHAEDDLDLDGMCATLDHSVREILS